MQLWTYLTSPKYYYGENVSNFRVHSLFNVNKAYDVRSDKNDDPLYLRIEAEPGNDYTSSDTQNGTYAKNFTPVRQIVININADNKLIQNARCFSTTTDPTRLSRIMPRRNPLS